MKKTVKRIWNIITSIIVGIAVLLAVALVGVRLVGFQVFSVLSGSMEPTYHVGSLIYVKNVDYRELQPGDVITFLLDEDTVATHRIVEVVPDENEPETLRYRTKGDANEAEDGKLVHYKNVKMCIRDRPQLAQFSPNRMEEGDTQGLRHKEASVLPFPVVCGTYPYPGSELPPYIAYSGVLLNPGAYNEMPDPSTV